LVIHTTMLVGLWFALSQTDFHTRTRVSVWLAVAVPVTAWLAIVWWLALDGAFRPRPGVPALPLAIFLPVLMGVAVST
jgi:bacteriorhodopsin